MPQERATLPCGCSSLRSGPRRVKPLIAYLLLLSKIYASAAFLTVAASVVVDPQLGSDTASCGSSPPCQTIAYALTRVNTGAAGISLSAGVYNESTVIINGVASLVVSGAPSATVFDCSNRSGAAFVINNSIVAFNGITFQNCHNLNSNGGALSASGSSITVSQCSFTNCSAASGGAMSVSGPSRDLFLTVHNSSFSGNSAVGGMISCPGDPTQPCSTWGGAVAAFEMLNVTISGCRMVANTARGVVPHASKQNSLFSNAVAGGGCVSLLFSGNASWSTLHATNNTFDACEVHVSDSVNVGNGYGGALSIYFGLSSALLPLDVSFVSILLLRNLFSGCIVTVSSFIGNSYGGALSVYIGAYSSAHSFDENTLAAVSDTVARSVNVTLQHAQFTSCSSMRSTRAAGNVYGGSFSVYIGAYSLSYTHSSQSRSKSGTTTVIAASVSVSDTSCYNCSAVTGSGAIDGSVGGSSHGGAMSAVYIGSYVWSIAAGDPFDGLSSSFCDFTRVIGLVISISTSVINGAMALSNSNGQSLGANVFGGAISVMVGSYVRSQIGSGESKSSSGYTQCSDCRVRMKDVTIFNSSAVSQTLGGSSNGAFVQGGGVAVAIGAHVWNKQLSDIRLTAIAGDTVVSGLLGTFDNCSISKSRALSNTSATDSQSIASLGSNAIGGGVAVVVGASIFNAGEALQWNTSVGSTSIQNSHVILTQSSFVDCSAGSFTGGSSSASLGTSSVYGGAFAVLHAVQVSEFRQNLLTLNIAYDLTGFNFTVAVSKSNFSMCSALTMPTSIRPGLANGGGGAVYARSVALANFSVTDSIFTNCSVYVTRGASGMSSNSSGGALAVEFPGSSVSSFTISSCRFFNCTAKGASMTNMAVRGGAVSVFRAAVVSVSDSKFINCSIAGAALSIDAIGAVASGGAGLCASLIQNASIYSCQFDAAGGVDDSQKSAGLLVLAHETGSTHVEVVGTSMWSNAVVFSVQCVHGDALQPFVGRCGDVAISVKNTNFSQLGMPTNAQFAATGGALMSLYNVSSFSASRLRCALSTQFAVIKRPTATNPFMDEFSCRPCPTFTISSSAPELLLERLSNAPNVADCVPSSTKSVVQSSCPFGVASCTTFVRVPRGFWTNFSDSGSLEASRRCPRGYCACSDSDGDSCLLLPLLSIDRNSDPLCSGNRTGKLCGGCRADHTQSMDGKTCIRNDECRSNLWWVWTLSALGFALFSLYVVLTCGAIRDNAFSCMLFYLQISSFASIPSDANDRFRIIFEISQVRSFVSFAVGACFAPDTSAYSATAFKLVGPLLVLVFSLLWTALFRALQPQLLRSNIQVEVSYSGTLTVVLFFVFSSVATVVFTLVQCTSYDDSGVVFIDGTVPCIDGNWKGLVAVVVLLCLFPVAFFLALWLNKLPDNARTVVCRSFTEPMWYWQVLTLSFRLLISSTLFLQVDYPNLLAFVRMMLSLGMFSLLSNLRPHVFDHTFWVDLVCYACLIAQFGLQTLFADRDYLRVTVAEEQRVFFDSMGILSSIFRYIPIAVFVVAWLKTKIYFGITLRSAGKRFRDAISRLKRFICRETPQQHEMSKPLNDASGFSCA